MEHLKDTEMTNPRTASKVLAAGALLFGMSGASLGAPMIDGIAPEPGIAGARVTIVGRGFEADNTISFGNTQIRHVGITSAIAISCTANPQCKPGIRQKLEFVIPRKTRGGSYRVSVSNASGASNVMSFTVKTK
jgi:IPT/TIG domain